jgi:hypothetical protein
MTFTFHPVTCGGVVVTIFPDKSRVNMEVQNACAFTQGKRIDPRRH